MTSRAMIFVLVGFSTLVWAAGARADFRQDYEKAMKAYEDGDYNRAITELRSALSEKDQENLRQRSYGMRFMKYLPHFYLGQSLYQAGDCDGALAAWSESERQGVIQEDDLFSELQSSMNLCQVQTIDVTAIAQAAQTAIGRMDSRVSEFSGLQSESLLAGEWRSRWAGELSEGQGSVANLQSRLDQAIVDTDADAIEAIQREAVNGASAMQGTIDLALAQVENTRQQQAQNDREAVATARRQMTQAVSAAEDLQAPPGNVEEPLKVLWAGLTSEISNARAIGDESTEGEYRTRAQAISSSARQYQLALQQWQTDQQTIRDRTPPDALKLVADAFFAGDFAQVKRIADPAAMDSDRARLQAHLFRAAASYRLFVLSGELDDSALAEAETDIRAIKQIDASFMPYVAAFSPRFLNLFRQTS